MDFSSILDYLTKSGITTFIFGWLSIYFIASLTIFISRFFGVKEWHSKESEVLEALLMGMKISTTDSILKKFSSGTFSSHKAQMCLSIAQKKSTSGLTWLSIIASTSPFIGLFGTVVSILQTFATLGNENVSLGVIAPAISEALVATGFGIFVAIPAYTFNLILKRKSYELLSVIEQCSDIMLEKIDDNKI